MADEIKREIRDVQDEGAMRRGPRTMVRARLLVAAILTMALLGALVPLSALGASGSGAVTAQQTATATRGTATVVGTVVGTTPRTATAVSTPRTVTPSPTVAATATAVPTAVAAPATATAAVPGMPRTGGGGTLWGIEVAWMTVAAFVLLALAGAAVVTSRRRAS